jgi:hypothetical protein
VTKHIDAQFSPGTARQMQIIYFGTFYFVDFFVSVSPILAAPRTELGQGCYEKRLTQE